MIYRQSKLEPITRKVNGELVSLTYEHWKTDLQLFARKVQSVRFKGGRFPMRQITQRVIDWKFTLSEVSKWYPRAEAALQSAKYG